MADSKKPNVITTDNASPEQLSAWERWQLPNMEEGLPEKQNALNVPGKRRPARADAPAHEEPEIRPLTAEDLEAIRQAAFEEGLVEGREAGKAEGYEAGFQSGESDVKALMTRLGQITRTLMEPIPAQDQELEQTLLQMVEQICKRVVHRELNLESSAVLRVVQEAIDCLNPGVHRLRIHLNKQDLELVSQSLRESGEWEEQWRIVSHPNITPGGCIIETDTSMIDARAERRLASVIQQVYEQQQHALEEGGQQHGHVDQLLDEIEHFPGDAEEELLNDPVVKDDGSESAS